MPLCFVLLTSLITWFAGPYLHILNTAPLAEVEKRSYVILFLFLLWLLKFLLLDMDAAQALSTHDLPTKKKIAALQNRFHGVLKFLKKAQLSKDFRPGFLNQLPWYLLIGPTGSGKTALLANAGVHYIFHRQFPDKQSQAFQSSANCDWWITRNTALVDVPGHYLCSQHAQTASSKNEPHALLFRFLLRLIKRYRGKFGTSGIVLFLPFPEIMKQSDQKKYHHMLRQLFQRIYELKKTFPCAMPCYLVITKCDLLTGFEQYFNELGPEEAAETWGFSLEGNLSENKMGLIEKHFNELIKKLNQQLISRLHQERNPIARPYIKEFPLQVEKLKALTEDFIQKIISAELDLSFKGVYLTSALQAPLKEAELISQAIQTTQRSLQIFKAPPSVTRAYFIRQLIAHGLGSLKINHQHNPLTAWKKRGVYAVSFSLILIVTFFLGNDFRSSIAETRLVQQHLANYPLLLANAPINERLSKTIAWLHPLQTDAEVIENHYFLFHFFNYYSKKSHQNIQIAYHRALKNILLPEIAMFIENYLSDPLKKDTNHLYQALTAYLMLGNRQYFQVKEIIKTIQEILPESEDKKALLKPIQAALEQVWEPLPLNLATIQQTRNFLLATPKGQLSYLILKNMNRNSHLQPLNLGISPSKHNAFILDPALNEVPLMFTADYFPVVLSEDTTIAGKETIFGNWILGENLSETNNPAAANALIDQLRIRYVNQYIEIWENLLGQIQLNSPKNLAQLDTLILMLFKEDSPLLQFLQTVHDNTYFEPVLSSSFKLKNLDRLVSKTPQSDNSLPQLLTALKELHFYLQTILNAPDKSKTAFEAVTKRIRNHEADALTTIRFLAEKSPEPLQTWLKEIANTAWHSLMQEAANYIDTAWQNKVIKIYQNEIANRYPFEENQTEEVALNQFSKFFGSAGIFMNFYQDYLTPFIEITPGNWQWKKWEGLSLPFSPNHLQPIQQAMLIHSIFFPKNDNTPFIQFSLKRYQIGKKIQSVKLTINKNKMIDLTRIKNNIHTLTWPNAAPKNSTHLQLMLRDHKMILREFPGAWGWFRLVNQTVEDMLPNEKLVLNLSADNQKAKYILQANYPSNPFLKNTFDHFLLPTTLKQKKIGA